MNDQNDSLRERLLRQHDPEPEKLATFRKETQTMLDREERRLRFFGRFIAANWIFLVVMATMYVLVAGWSRDQPTKVYFSIGVMLMMLSLGGVIQLISGFISRARLDVVKDIKGLELRLIELENLIREQAK